LAIYLPGFIRQAQIGDITVTQYEPGFLPTADADMDDIFATININGVSGASDVNIEIIELNEGQKVLQSAQEILGTTLFVPTYLRHNEVPVFMFVIKDENLGDAVSIRYQNAVYDREKNVIIPNDSNNLSSFHVNQQYVGDAKVIYDVTVNFIEHEVNGHSAVWVKGTAKSPNNGSLMWIQDGMLITIAPIDLAFEYVIKIAESMQPWQNNQ